MIDYCPVCHSELVKIRTHPNKNNGHDYILCSNSNCIQIGNFTKEFFSKGVIIGGGVSRFEIFYCLNNTSVIELYRFPFRYNNETFILISSQKYNVTRVQKILVTSFGGSNESTFATTNDLIVVYEYTPFKENSAYITEIGTRMLNLQTFN